MNKQQKLNKYCFGLGTVGRDALYSLVSMYLLVHLTEVVRFSDENLKLVGIILTCFGVFDAVIDPFVGAIVDNTKTKWGKFKPYIVCAPPFLAIFNILTFTVFPVEGAKKVGMQGIVFTGYEAAIEKLKEMGVEF